ncbi:ScbA/BarX family gamma-butyrolactone biosynthesis protein [Streptomyces sp.]|uniref:ScbA/BarX family gamma-butyrolactone biosynthesis protein n=1 Tax=Streptomyces sp. TaxID=1931 RepID=UPI002D2553C1|nr:ScbA/BarX family gamma-butyrolactone biosynthesis protein [Streptomyces sp.]HZF92294.1 ScbA/BarX family gamma-butyrolactone biosynthesis protein [Streptomyces sp.]
MTKPLTIDAAVETPRVAQRSVHKFHADQVLLTGWRRVADNCFVVTARWPGDHPLYAVRGGHHDPLLLSETVRQSFPLLSHHAYDVPFGHHLVWDTYAWRLDPAALWADGSPAAVELHVSTREVVRRRGSVAVLALDYEILRGGVPLASAESRFTIQAPAVYRRLRGSHADPAAVRPIPVPPAIPACLAGRDRAADVVLAPAGPDGRWQLRVDTGHRGLFDHPVDHVPGMLLLEAARQAAHALHDRPSVGVTAMETRFLRYAELDAPAWIEARPTGRDAAGRPTLSVTGTQNGRELFDCAVTLDEGGPRRS